MIRLLALCTTVLFCITANATTYYFSNTGSNANTGTTTGSPYLDIGKLNSLSLTAFTDIILFKGGDSFLGQITQTTAGITYGSYGTGKATLTGLVSLTSWSNLGSNIWSSSINSGAYLDVLLWGNVFVQQGRSPNAGSYWNIDSHTNATGGIGGGVGGDVGWTGQTFTSTSIASVNYNGGRAVIGKNQFNTDRDIITASSTNTLTYFTYNGNPIKDDGNKFFIQSHLSTVTAQNEWYYDPVAHVVKMYSTSTPAGVGFKAAQYDFAFRIYNTSGTNTNGVTFRNLVFVGYDSVALSFTGVNNIVIKSCEFYNIGGDAIAAMAAPVGGNYSTIYGDYPCNNLIADSNIIYKCGNTGIDNRFTATGVYARYNMIDSCGAFEGMGFPNNQQRNGIQNEYAGGPFGNVNNDSVIYEGNVIKHSGYCGIRWEGAKAQIRNNLIDGYGLQTSDGGGIYTSRNAGDSATIYRRIHHNTIINSYGNNAMVGGSVGGMPAIYFDDVSVNVLCDSNTIYNSTRYGIFCHNNRNITIQYNNIFQTNTAIESGIGIIKDGLEPWYSTRGMNVQYNNMYVFSNKLHEFQSIIASGISASGDISNYGTMNNNRFAKSSGTNYFRYYNAGSQEDYTSLAAWVTAYGYEAASTYKTVSPDSAALFYNAQAYPVTSYFIGSTYRTLSGTNYSDQVLLQPGQSIIAFKVTYIPTVILPPTGTYILQLPREKRNHLKL